jgi:hypothetical protein
MTIKEFVERLKREGVRELSRTSIHRMVATGVIVGRPVARNPLTPMIPGNIQYDISEEEYQRVKKSYTQEKNAC